ncbi:MAG: hypothetical protein FJ098_08790, partial [Deltaproteobacteria bacterium]|nr:hypothetical protein [Deltaproteobacteria bacterium]
MPLTASLGGVVEMDDGAEPVPGIEEGGEPVAPHPETPGPALEPLTLGHMIDHSWGIRLPGCETAPALEARIGPPPYTLELEGAPDPELPPRFPRETVIVVSRKEIVVNDLRVADVLQVPGKDDKDSTWVVPRSEGSGRVPALTSQLQQDVGHRATILRASGFSPEQAEGCDVATILMDEELPYRILAEVILSAGHADLFRFRLGTRSRDGVISYMAVTAPRLAPDVVGAFRLFGDAWWTSGIPQATDFEFALVNYIAAEETELRRGECDNDLPVCLDPGISSLEALRNRELSDRLASSLDGVRRSSRTPGCFVPAPVDNGASEVSLPGAASGAAAGPPGDADAAAETGSGQRPEEPGTGAAPEEEPVPAGTLVVTGESRTSVPFVYVRPDGAWLVLRDLPRGEVRRSEFFLYEGIDLLAMRMRELAPEAGVLFL